MKKSYKNGNQTPTLFFVIAGLLVLGVTGFMLSDAGKQFYEPQSQAADSKCDYGSNNGPGSNNGAYPLGYCPDPKCTYPIDKCRSNDMKNATQVHCVIQNPAQNAEKIFDCCAGTITGAQDTLACSSSASGTPTATNTGTPTATNTGTPSVTNTPTGTNTGTPSVTNSGTPTGTTTATPPVTTTMIPSCTRAPLPSGCHYTSDNCTNTAYTCNTTPTVTKTPSVTHKPGDTGFSEEPLLYIGGLLYVIGVVSFVGARYYGVARRKTLD